MKRYTPLVVWLISACCTNGFRSCTIQISLTWTVSEEILKLKCKVSNLHFRVQFIDPYNKVVGECLPAYQTSKCDKYSANVNIHQNMTTNETTYSVRGKIDERFNGNWKCLHGTNKFIADVDVTVLRYEDGHYRAMLFLVMGYFGAVTFWLTVMNVCPLKVNIIAGLFKYMSCKRSIRRFPVFKGVTFGVLTVLILTIFGILSNSTDNNCKFQYVYISLASLTGLLIAILFLNKEEEIRQHRCDDINQNCETEEEIRQYLCDDINQNCETEAGIRQHMRDDINLNCETEAGIQLHVRDDINKTCETEAGIQLHVQDCIDQTCETEAGIRQHLRDDINQNCEKEVKLMMLKAAVTCLEI